MSNAQSLRVFNPVSDRVTSRSILSIYIPDGTYSESDITTYNRHAQSRLSVTHTEAPTLSRAHQRRRSPTLERAGGTPVGRHYYATDLWHYPWPSCFLTGHDKALSVGYQELQAYRVNIRKVILWSWLGWSDPFTSLQ
ncbi:hypothetical protein KXX54_002289 [Aspergillus fumigatus]|nr:hypothetical protein KXX54_002289 [Aspergillus fumigatus]